MQSVARASLTPPRTAAPGAVMPPEDRCAPAWTHPVPTTGSGVDAPLWWWVPAHGGAGASTLTALMLPSGDARGKWPSAHPSESPLVVVVARTHHRGLAAAQDLLTQHHAGGTPPGLRLLGLVTIADAPGRLPGQLRRFRSLVAAGAPRHWDLPWVPSWRAAPLAEMPQWEPGDAPAPRKHRGDPRLVPPEYAACAHEIHQAAIAAAKTYHDH